MAGRRRTDLEVEAERRNAEQLARLGAQVRAARRVRHLTQAALGERAGVSRATVSRLELGRGGGLTLDAWQRIRLAAARPMVVNLQQPTDGDTADAGRLGIQELVLRLGAPRRLPGAGRAADEAERTVAVHRRRAAGRRAPTPRGG